MKNSKILCFWFGQLKLYFELGEARMQEQKAVTVFSIQETGPESQIKLPEGWLILIGDAKAATDFEFLGHFVFQKHGCTVNTHVFQ